MRSLRTGWKFAGCVRHLLRPFQVENSDGHYFCGLIKRALHNSPESRRHEIALNIVNVYVNRFA
jgi:hypothetical protein